MKKYIFGTLFVLTLLTMSGVWLIATPYYYYNEIVNKDGSVELFSLSNNTSQFTTGGERHEISSGNIANENLWQKFHFEDLRIPLPVKNPFYFVAPIINFDKSTAKVEFGLSIYNIHNKDIAKIYFLPNRPFPELYDSQKLFELPISRKFIKKIPISKIWKDLFTKNITDWNIPYNQMVYNLYLLQMRSELFNMKFIKYWYYDELNTGVLELESKNRDFNTQLVVTRRGETLFSYIIVTSKTLVESQLLANKFLKEIEFEHSNFSLSDILLKEFKALTYPEQTDHKGMLYLLSSWSHNRGRKEFLEKAIFFLERGQSNQMQLKPLYSYMNQRYEKTYANQMVDDLELENDLLLQRNIEIEKRNEQQKVNTNKRFESLVSEKEGPDKLLEKAKKNKKKRKDSLKID